jgi:Domain of unknown function (DUF4926)
MKDETIKMLDIVALLKEIPEQKLLRGQIGTVIERYSDTEFEVEFSDNTGKTLAMLLLTTDDIMVLHYELEYASTTLQ